ncbi:MAG: hypothetical protein HYV26_18780 [Candidatus Hydrogenedentes bacterium]|nr:hypothetical protein [Candidatus Hydrogenedentota bacterium]
MKPLQGESLTAEWQEFSFEATTYADSTIADNFSSFSIGSALDTAAASPVRVWLDDIRLEDSNAETPSGFIRPAVEAMKEARCGVLRFYGTSSLGSLVEEFTAENTTQAPWSFVSLASFFRFNSTDTVLDQWMELSREVGARPWVNVGSANSPDDWYRLVSYLAAPAEFDDDAKRRAAHGYAAPWTETFDKIYLEIGNEWWNSIFSPYYLWDPVKHGELCKNIIAKVQEHPHLQADKIEIIAGGWAVNAHHWNGVVDATSQGQDSISIAPYLLHKLDNSKTPEDKYRTLFADVDAYLQGPGASTLEDLEKNAKQTSLAIYELNTHLTGGSAGPKVASEICPSLAAGVAVLDKAMALMASMKTNPIVYFTLLQRSFQDRLGLWGVLIRTPDGELRPRPVWQGLRLANQYLIDGPMLKVEVEGSPTWDQPENGSIAETDNVPYIHAYAFRPKGDKERLNVLLINRHLSQPFRMTVVLPFRPAPAAQRVILSGENPADNNEEREQIQVREEKVDNFDGTVTVPACSAVVYQLSE